MTIVKYVACFACGKTIALNKFNAVPYDIDPSDYLILQVREQVGGRSGQGFFNVEGAGKNIVELQSSDDPQEREIAETFKTRLLSIVASYIRSGVISKQEISDLSK